jgi:hypothetical protein
MGKTSSAAKNKWCSANYTQIKISVKPELATAFKATCKSGSITVTGDLSRYMVERCSMAANQKRPAKDQLATRGGRRKLLAQACRQIEQILEAETRYFENIPPNLRGAANYEAVEQCIADITEALELLDMAL